MMMLGRKLSVLLCISALACIVLAYGYPGRASLEARQYARSRWRHEYDSSGDNDDDDDDDGLGYRRWGGGNSDTTRGDDSSGQGGSTRGGALSFDTDQANRVRTIHGILAAVMFVGVFPVGAILLRIVKGRVWLHGGIQIVGFVGYMIAAAMGIWLALYVRIPSEGGTVNLFEVESVRFHPIIGLVVLATLFFQPLFGILHHRAYKRTGGRQAWSHLHLWTGRLMVPLGMANGALGLWVSGASRTVLISYSAVAAAVWAVWMIFAVVVEVRRGKRATGETAGATGLRKAEPASRERGPGEVSPVSRLSSSGDEPGRSLAREISRPSTVRRGSRGRNS